MSVYVSSNTAESSVNRSVSALTMMRVIASVIAQVRLGQGSSSTRLEASKAGHSEFQADAESSENRQTVD